MQPGPPHPTASGEVNVTPMEPRSPKVAKSHQAMAQCEEMTRDLMPYVDVQTLPASFGDVSQLIVDVFYQDVCHLMMTASEQRMWFDSADDATLRNVASCGVLFRCAENKKRDSLIKGL